MAAPAVVGSARDDAATRSTARHAVAAAEAIAVENPCAPLARLPADCEFPSPPRTRHTHHSSIEMGRGGKSATAAASSTPAAISADAVKGRGLIVISGHAYEVTPAFLTAHPGGAVALTQRGADATDVFRAFHTGSSRSFAALDAARATCGATAAPGVDAAAAAAMGLVYVGPIAAPLAPLSPFEQEYRTLYAKLAAQGKFSARCVRARGDGNRGATTWHRAIG